MDQTEALDNFLSSIGEEVEDAEEESFLLFSRDIPSANLGFVDSRATTVEVAVHGQDYSISQSPTLLSSSRAGGTTGAVLWKITPLFAEWISAAQSNPLWKHSLLTSSSTVVELGCGISGLIALALGRSIRHYVATDQEYVHRLLRENLEANTSAAAANTPKTQPKPKGKKRAAGGQQKPPRKQDGPSNITFAALDWELDVPASLRDSIGLQGDDDHDDDGADDKGFDLLLSCDCIYNEALVAPFVRTCADFCRLRPVHTTAGRRAGRPPTICIIAQQQRSPDVFEAWLQETLSVFRVWRLSDEALGEGLRSGTGYVVHLLLLREGATHGGGDYR
ncbi:S-adenosylmethionine-dependent methyltransferase [Aspergillus thermomutatus]|uniref:Diaminohydroxyphosphoribosylamino-pyrimidine deaminase n=1 Tax=Aspergillus thermomutatus TaxID=41047 RepID=A0A397H0K3_ASPTH|nr:uncharacterized protein CDV56_106368 [Aspergillus thermomutatus]RHZ56209.1 hypothetical protein CDV56_106368 [Aspergillus thermomutatus]